MIAKERSDRGEKFEICFSFILQFFHSNILIKHQTYLIDFLLDHFQNCEKSLLIKLRSQPLKRRHKQNLRQNGRMA